ncbi:MAG TPA: fused MFS/spermidine synthase [Mycobacteriales bacterium]|nr:fused MFS/spermidine synthase [Mycobacteriales bacterium]
MRAPQLIPDAVRPGGRWLLVDGSEQSYVDVDDPTHLEFEYVQMIAYVVESVLRPAKPVTALHLGGGLCTLPRWLAQRHPRSQQLVAERSREIAAMAQSLGEIDGVTIAVDDAVRVLSAYPSGAADLVVCDLYDGPETVPVLFPLDRMAQLRGTLRRGGTCAVNLSDASPFDFSRVVAATMSAVFGGLVLLAEPAVLRGRRSGNVVLAGRASGFPIAALTRRAAAGPVRARVVAGEELADFVGDALPAGVEADLPPSAESLGQFR